MRGSPLKFFMSLLTAVFVNTYFVSKSNIILMRLNFDENSITYWVIVVLVIMLPNVTIHFLLAKRDAERDSIPLKKI